MAYRARPPSSRVKHSVRSVNIESPIGHVRRAFFLFRTKTLVPIARTGVDREKTVRHNRMSEDIFEEGNKTCEDTGDTAVERAVTHWVEVVDIVYRDDFSCGGYREVFWQPLMLR